jgi:serine/threonine protein kinase
LIADRYEIIGTLGQGTFGRTFLARDTVGGHTVAIKMLDTRGVDWKAHELFEREAAVLRGLRHQGIPQVFEAFKAPYDGVPASFLVMEHIEGTSLAATIAARQSLEDSQVLPILLELLGILEYLHNRIPPVLHRDIKPANIIVRSNGFPALVDFGSVRHVHLGPDESGSTVAGTYGYMPYEQYMGQASPSSDLYALGATFLHLLTGRPPREFMNEEGRIQVPATLPGDPRLQPIITRLLRPSPAERFAGASEVRQALLSPAVLPASDQRPGQLVPRTIGTLRSLPPAPRPIEGPLAEALTRCSPSGWDLMDASSKSSGSVGWLDVFGFIFYSLITAGVLPMVFFSMASSRRRRLEKFFQQGELASAEILSITLESVAFGEKMARVNYQFPADGDMRRDTDQIMPIVAHRWHPGDRVQVLYIAGEDYDSVIIST